VKEITTQKVPDEVAFDEHGCVLIPQITSKDVVDFRQRLGMTQEDFAARFDIPLATLRNWEQKRSKPVISETRLVFYNKLFDEKAKVIKRVESRKIRKAA
jgi:DNA-binding transcriptional regulator YiaG